MMNQKTNRLLCTLLACLLLLTAIPLTASAVNAAPAPQDADGMPTVLPDGHSIDLTKLWVDWDVAGVDDATVENGFNKVTTADKKAWTHNGVNTTSWKGASGLMFYVDAEEIGENNVNFILDFLTSGVRPKDASVGGAVQLSTSPTLGSIQTGITSYAYCYQNGGWKEFQVSYPTYYLNAGTNASGWYYVPLESFWYAGGSATGYDVKSTGILNFVDFMSRFQDQTIWKISMRSKSVGLKFGDVHFVYSHSDVAPENAAVAPLFGTMALNGNPEGAAKGTVENNAVTVSGMTGNSNTASGNRVWLKGLSQTNLSGASGLRFYVDTSVMGAEAQVQLRLRMRAGVAIGDVKNIYANSSSGGYAALTGGMPQYVCRSDNSVAYYYDESGTAKVLSIASDVSANMDMEGDLFEALPCGYRGYVYIPFDSFYMSCGSYKNLKCAVPFAEAMKYYPIDLITICSAVSGTDTDSVTYSNFELVYKDTAMTGASVSLTNNLNINFYADVQDGATDVRMNFIIGGKNVTVDGVKQENGSYRFVCSGLLPQTAVDTVYATLSATVNGVMVTQQTEYSVRDYCERMLKREDTSDELRTLLVDLLYYAEAAQIYATYKTDDLATKNLTDAQKALRSEDSTAAITAAAGKTGTPDARYNWVSAALRLENTLAVRFKFNAASIEGVTVDVTINGRTVTFEEFEGENGVYTLIFNNIGAAEYDSEITAVIRLNGEQVGETLTYCVAAYIGEAVKNAGSGNLKELLRAVYSYGSSAKAYAEKGAVQQ